MFVYRKKRGAAKAKLTWSDKAFAANPMIIIPITPREDLRLNMYLINVNNMPGFPSINSGIVQEAPVEHVQEPVVQKRAYKRKEKVASTVAAPVDEGMSLRKRKDTAKPVEKVKRLKKTVVAPIINSPVIDKPRRGRPSKNWSCLIFKLVLCFCYKFLCYCDNIMCFYDVHSSFLI